MTTYDDDIEAFITSRKKATINDVARLARLSKKTVSRVINASPSVRAGTRDQVNAVIDRIGFRPDPQARGLAFRRSFLIGLIYDNPNAQYVVNMQLGALDGLRGSGTELVLHPCDRHSDQFIKDIRDFIELQRLSGVIVLPPISEDKRLLALLEDLDTPYVRVSALHPATTTGGHAILSKERIGCRAAGEHLAQLGHTRIGFIAGPDGYLSASERRAGFREGLQAHGLDIEPSLEVQGDYTLESGHAAALRLLTSDTRPTALFAGNDEMAIGAYKAAFGLGLRIPGDLSICGYDDSPMAERVYPPLTTVHLPTRDMARAAVLTLLRSEGAPEDALIFESALVVRQSTAKV
ncbi:putative HTH-type transcriptional repressor ExuR [Asticcacaulis sp. MM231]|uniref:LacI family DNA-binding transcriptional regulator n=1 Tax=Asticcacaulis sp. MM231 TaxID=3157666 RepID=UPI0032D59AAB